MNLSHQPAQSFDGNMVMLVKGPITYSFFDVRRRNVLFHDSNKARFRPLSYSPAYGAAEGRPFGRDPWEDRKRKKRITEIVHDGKVKLALLIDSIGGSIEIMTRITSIVDDVRRRGGFIASFGAGNVDSAAAQIFMAADRDRRYLAEQATMMFHLSSGVYRRSGKLTTAGDQEWVAMRRFLVDATREEVQDEISVLLDEAEKKADTRPDRRIDLSTEQAQRFRFAKVSARNGLTLREQFRHVIGIGLQNYPRGSRVDNFFANIDESDGMAAADAIAVAMGRRVARPNSDSR